MTLDMSTRPQQSVCLHCKIIRNQNKRKGLGIREVGLYDTNDALLETFCSNQCKIWYVSQYKKNYQIMALFVQK